MAEKKDQKDYAVGQTEKKKGSDMGVKISVVIASLNSGDVIEQAICSFMEQSYRNKELIVIDGGSVDGTPDIIEKYRSGISVYISEKDRGVYDAFNKGVLRASGDYVLFLGADDSFYNRNALGKVAKWIAKRDFPDLLSTQILYIDKSWAYIEKKTSLYNWREGIRRKQPMIPHQGLYTKRSILLEHPFSLEYKICSDLEFYAYCCNTEKRIEYVETVNAYFSRQGLTSKNDSIRNIEEMRILAAYGEMTGVDHQKSGMHRKLLRRMEERKIGMLLLIKLRGFRIHNCRNSHCRWCDYNRSRIFRE